MRLPRWHRGRHRTDARTVDPAAGSITAMRQAGLDSVSDGSPKGPGSRQSWRVAHMQAQGATRGYEGEATFETYDLPLVETWESCRNQTYRPRV